MFILIIAAFLLLFSVLIALLIANNKKITPQIKASDNCDIIQNQPDLNIVLQEKQIMPPSEIIIGKSADNPVAKISMVDKFSDIAKIKELKPLNISNQTLLNKLNPFIQATPNLLLSENIATNKYMKVVVNNGLARAADGIGYRGFAKGADGKIIEHAKLFEPDKLLDMSIFASGFQILSIVVGQKHLADISRKLDEIKKDISDIKEFLNNERTAKIIGISEMLKQYILTVSNGETYESIRNTLEYNEKDLLGIEEHLKKELLEARAELQNLKQEGLWNANGKLNNKIESMCDDIKNKFLELNFVINLRILNLIVLQFFTGNENLVLFRRNSIINDITDLYGNNENSLYTLKTQIEDKLKNFYINKYSSVVLRGVLRRDLVSHFYLRYAKDKIKKYKQNIKNKASEFTELVENNHKEIQNNVEFIERKNSEFANNSEIVIELENNKIKNVYQLPNNS
ncbi:MAG: hypothetical protein ACYCS0_01425 [bacterium]